MQKRTQTYRWQEYNKQNDIGLVTFYQHQNSKDKQTIKASISHQPPSDTLQNSLFQHQRGNQRYIQSFRRKNRKYQEQEKYLGKIVSIKAKQRTQWSKRRESIKLGYYDVSQMSNLQSSCRGNNSPQIHHLLKCKRSSTLPSPKIINQNLQMPQLNSKRRIEVQPLPLKHYIITKQQKQKTQSNLNEVQIKAFGPHLKKRSTPLRDSKLINFIQYRLSKLNQKKKHFRNQFNNKEHPLPLRQSIQKVKNKSINQLRVPLNLKLMNDTRLREIISMYFTPTSSQNKKNQLY